eukprot:gnl/MRDRNA2_/MRDRNA2_61621_c0_seq1.p1 gnl/MRDRNA2_/MRDRNA2_61621_c0~~gnl/MRDRNA2_/MRDRNA2_61621_c0_seq1.p1  ORF type:complete len:717 (+),score=86.72 gnl/MRDRNA2_/MRDRNA2_61621_c0_seq1:268-2151(+)
MAQAVPGVQPSPLPRSQSRVLADQAAADNENIAAFHGLTDEQKASKMEEMKGGTTLKDTLPPYPQSRGCRDCCCALFFLATAGAVIVSCALYTGNIKEEICARSPEACEGFGVDGKDVTNVIVMRDDVDEVSDPAIKDITEARSLFESFHEYVDIRQSQGSNPFLAVGRRLRSSTSGITWNSVQKLFIVSSVVALIAGITSLLGTLALCHYVRTNTESMLNCVVWLVPLFAMLIVGCCAGGVMMSLTRGGDIHPLAVVYAGIGALYFMVALCTCCCGCCLAASGTMRINVLVTKHVCTVLSQHKAMILIALWSFFMWLGWIVMCITAAWGLLLVHEDKLSNTGKEIYYVLFFFFVLVFVWGTGVCRNCAVVAQSGVYGRYHYEMQGKMTMPSVQVALTTSFGPVCFGSLCVAIVRAIEWTAAVLKPDADDFRENPIQAIILYIVCRMVECIMEWIGDILEYFNMWAYVQCAVRNASFIEAAKITYSMCTLANITLLVQDLLLSWVTDAITYLGGILGFGVGFAAALSGVYDGSFLLMGGVRRPISDSALAMPLIGFVAGIMGAGMCSSILEIGLKTLLVLWAEDPAPLMNRDPEFHKAVGSHIEEALEESKKAQAGQQEMQNVGAQG